MTTTSLIPKLRHILLTIVVIALSPQAVSLQTGSKKCTIKICHNKDCSKRGGGERLLQTFRDLLPAPSSSNNILVPSLESSGCLSQCGNGPNICVIKNGIEEKLFFGVSDPTTASAVLDVATGEDYPIELLVAADVISKAESTKSASKKEQLLTSAITQLTKDQNPTLLQSYAHGHALYLRADARLEKAPHDVKAAIVDANAALKIVPNEIKAWRVLATAHEAAGDYKAAILAVREWVNVDASFATKAKRELERLSSLP